MGQSWEIPGVFLFAARKGFLLCMWCMVWLSQGWWIPLLNDPKFSRRFSPSTGIRTLPPRLGADGGMREFLFSNYSASERLGFRGAFFPPSDGTPCLAIYCIDDTRQNSSKQEEHIHYWDNYWDNCSSAEPGQGQSTGCRICPLLSPHFPAFLPHPLFAPHPAAGKFSV